LRKIAREPATDFSYEQVARLNEFTPILKKHQAAQTTGLPSQTLNMYQNLSDEIADCMSHHPSSAVLLKIRQFCEKNLPVIYEGMGEMMYYRQHETPHHIYEEMEKFSQALLALDPKNHLTGPAAAPAFYGPSVAASASNFSPQVPQLFDEINKE